MQQESYRNDQEVQNAVKANFIGIVPERKHDLDTLFNRYRPNFNILEDSGSGGNFVMDAGAYRLIRFNHRAMRAFWLASFIAWEGYNSVHNGIVKGSEPDLNRFKKMIDCFTEILTVDNPSMVTLPEGVPQPGKYVDRHRQPETQATAEIATIALGWALLHEMHHLKHQQEGTAAPQEAPPEDRHAEELSCDEFATRFILERVNEYAELKHQSAAMIAQKREIGIYFAAFAMTLICKNNWYQTDTHPALQVRIDAIMQQMDHSRPGISDAIAYAANAALRCIWPNSPGPFRATSEKL